MDSLLSGESGRGSDGVAGGFCGVGSAGRGRPREGAVGKLVHSPLGVLFEPVVVTALRAGITQAGSSARFVWRVVLEVALAGGSPAYRAGTGGVPDLGQVPQPDPGVVAAGLVPVVAGVGGDRVDRDDQVRSGSGGAQPPGAVPAGRAVLADGSEGEPRRSGTGAFPVTLGFRARTAVPDGMAILVGHRHAPRGPGVGCSRAGEVAGQPRVDRAQPGQLAGTVRQAGHGAQRDGQRDPAGEPSGSRAGPAGREVAGWDATGRESLPSSRSR